MNCAPRLCLETQLECEFFAVEGPTSHLGQECRLEEEDA